MAGSAGRVNLDTDGTQSDQEERLPACPEQYDFVVFYSDSRSDREEAYKIAEYLEHENNGKFRGYLNDRDGKAGKTEIENLDFALEKCKAYIILLSKSFLQCNFSSFAMHTSLHTSVMDCTFSNRLLPLLVDVELTEMPSSLKIIQGIPYYPGEDVFWSKLKRSLESICSGNL